MSGDLQAASNSCQEMAFGAVTSCVSSVRLGVGGVVWVWGGWGGDGDLWWMGERGGSKVSRFFCC